MRRATIAGLIAAILSVTSLWADGINIPYVFRTKTITITLDLSVTGSTSYTGVGFKPTSCLFSGGIASASLAQYYLIIGFADTGLAGTSTFAIGGGLNSNNIASITLADATATNIHNASVSSYDADGFTLLRANTGTPTGTATIRVICASR